MRARGLALVAVLCGVGCKGSIEGRVFGTDDAQPLRLSGHLVFLLSTTDDVATALKSACPANAADWNERVRSERERLGQTAAAYGDSARDELAQRRGSRRWTALVRMMNIYRDSAARMDGRPPSVPSDLVEKLAVNRANTGDDGHFVFSELAPGTYLVATELRDEFRWKPVQVARTKAIADVTPQRSQASCDIARGL
jgi:hypothetical protein